MIEDYAYKILYEMWEIWGFRGGDVPSRSLLGCDARKCYGRVSVPQRSLLPPSSAPRGVAVRGTSTCIKGVLKFSFVCWKAQLRWWSEYFSSGSSNELRGALV